MVSIIDEHGRLFGGVNIIDAVVVLAIIAVVAAGAFVVFAPSTATATTAHATFETTIHPATVDELHPHLRGDDIQVTSIQSTEQVRVPLNGDETAVTRTRVFFTAEVPVELEDVDAEVQRTYWTSEHGRDRLVIGREYQLDFGRIVIDATLTDMEVAS